MTEENVVKPSAFAESSYYEDSLVPTNLAAGWLGYLENAVHFQIEPKHSPGTKMSATRFQFHVMGRTGKDMPNDSTKAPQDQLVFTVWNAGSIDKMGMFPEDFEVYKLKILSAWMLGRAVTLATNKEFNLNTYLAPTGLNGAVCRLWSKIEPLPANRQAQKDKTKYVQKLVYITPECDQKLVQKVKETHEKEQDIRLAIQDWIKRRWEERQKMQKQEDFDKKDNQSKPAQYQTDVRGDAFTTHTPEQAGINDEDLPF